MTKLLLAVSLMVSSLAFAGMQVSEESKATVSTVRGASTASTEKAEAPTTAEPKKESKTAARKPAPSRK